VKAKRRKRSVVIVPIIGAPFMMDENDLFDLRDAVPETALVRRGTLFGAQVWTLNHASDTRRDKRRHNNADRRTTSPLQ
jgi:hypothetical protein